MVGSVDTGDSEGRLVGVLLGSGESVAGLTGGLDGFIAKEVLVGCDEENGDCVGPLFVGSPLGCSVGKLDAISTTLDSTVGPIVKV